MNNDNVKYIIDTMAKNPMSFLPIIQTVLDPINPDSKKLISLVSKAIVNKIYNDIDLKKLIENSIDKSIHADITKSVNEIITQNQVQLSEDIQNSVVTTMKEVITGLCESYFQRKCNDIDEIFKDYFKSIQGIIKDKIKELEKKTTNTVQEELDKSSVDVKIPPNMKDDVIKYIEFLKSKEISK